MESFAFWYKKKGNHNKKNQVAATMNFNLWSQCNWDEAPYLDIGFKIKNLESAEELYFFLPFCIKEAEKTKYIEDLGCKFKHTELVDAVFNESYATTIAANKKTIKVETIEKTSAFGETEKFYIYQLDIEHDIKLEQFADGTIITIKTDDIINSVYKDDENNKKNVFYLRFRIKNLTLDSLIHKYQAPRSALQSLFNTTYMIDFRFHNIRSLDKTLIEKFDGTDTKVVGIEALHFLLMTKAYIDVSNKDFKSIRKIEQGVWKDYVNGNDTEDLLAYHFADKVKKSGSGEAPVFLASSEFFAKFRVEKTVFYKYLAFTLGMGVLGSIIGSFVIEVIKKFFC